MGVVVPPGVLEGKIERRKAAKLEGRICSFIKEINDASQITTQGKADMLKKVVEYLKEDFLNYLFIMTIKLEMSDMERDRAVELVNRYTEAKIRYNQLKTDFLYMQINENSVVE